MTATPFDLIHQFRERARYLLGTTEGERAAGQAVALLDCAADLEAALRAQAAALKATAAPLKKPAPSKPKKK